MSGARRRAVFLDRDGTLHRELDLALTEPGQLELLPGALEGVAELARAGYALVLVTNQSAIARGTATPAEVDAVNRALAERMAAAGAPLAGVYLCPHHPDEGDPPYRRACACRKPAPGLIQRAARELGLDLARSWVIGDAERDLAAGAALGVPGVLVLTGKGMGELERLKREARAPHHVARDLREAAAIVLARS
jgi:D-glycero-D-manno-heptose 1,7-bisphosphate phosphatase